VRNYELLYILSPELGEENTTAAIDKVNNIVTRLGGEVGEINSSSPWGKRRLTYPIKKFQDGVYVMANFRLTASRSTELEHDLRISEEVLRHLLICLEKED